VKVTYHVPEADVRKMTARPSYCGRTWDETLRSASITADAYGQARVFVTVGVPERRVGGKIVVTAGVEPAWPEGPFRLLATVR
jgi:hypothetical protein